MSSLPETLEIKPFQASRSWSDGPLWVRVPGSKSITNRALLLSALTPLAGPLALSNALASRDTRLMGAALRELGFNVGTQEGDGRIVLQAPDQIAKTAALDVGNAGTAARFLTAFLALQKDGCYLLDGDAQMRRRPMRGLLEALERGGTRFVFKGQPYAFPFEMHTCGMSDVPAVLAVDASASSQILSALLMTGPFWPKGTCVRLHGDTVSKPFVEMTCRMMRQYWGDAVIAQDADGYFRFGPIAVQVAARDYAVEPDATAASYFLSLPLAVPLSIGVRGLCADMLQGDIAYVRALKKTGVGVAFSPMGIAVSPAEHATGITENFNDFSDTFLTLAGLSPLLDGPTLLAGLAHTRHQETDRLAAMATELIKLGQGVEEGDDTLSVMPNQALLRTLPAPVWIDTYEDHRFAMSFGILGCHDAHGDGRPWLGLRDPGCCAKTFPLFFNVLADLKTLSEFPVVAIDGGAASGKSSTSRRLAQELHLMHVDTGAHYRAVTFALLQSGVSLDDAAAVAQALRHIALGSHVVGNSSQITFGGQLIEDSRLRSADVNAAVAKVAAIPAVRTFLKDYQRGQRAVASAHKFTGLVMEGRDIGSVIFPHAPLRFFLEADPAVRAARRQAEGQTDAVQERDRQDASRKTAPLTCPDGAERVDNSHLNLDEVVVLLAQKITPYLTCQEDC